MTTSIVCWVTMPPKAKRLPRERSCRDECRRQACPAEAMAPERGNRSASIDVSTARAVGSVAGSSGLASESHLLPHHGARSYHVGGLPNGVPSGGGSSGIAAHIVRSRKGTSAADDS